MKCARTVCHNEARCKHSQSGRLYCIPCARKINNAQALFADGVPNLIELPSTERLVELWQLIDPKRLKTDEEARTGRERIAEICLLYGVEFPEEVFERYER
jgi:hypothetical protein